ncbi:putative Kinesin heavy chain [Blattamonas nauphoetae]|uniref:Kinesin heavy chain n=1 Tax=Blattamonas nauphoetae TaxID=2049346 RepID=A0ABQ9WZT8_9EUKA|nr:putative Kinesin heavy chain [Blattamonas nauphoetae]
MTSSSGGGDVKVVARFRPLNSLEKSKNGQLCVELKDDQQSLVLDVNGQKRNYNFDHVFPYYVDQGVVYDVTARQVIDDVLNGVNGTILAYGQTSSGKTFTMMGPDDYDEKSQGIIPRMVDHILDRIKHSPKELEYLVQGAYAEIYLERIRDLLDISKTNLEIHQKKNNIYIEGITWRDCKAKADFLDMLALGDANRKTAATGMNDRSSRSHTIFMVKVTQRNRETDSTKTGLMYLVDLAGSEKIGQTGAEGQQLEEAKKINLSLTSLGNVIKALTDPAAKHVPYRDSKLTRLLQETFGGNSRTVLVINSSGSSTNAFETQSTLEFGKRAKEVKNKVVVNQELSNAELKAMLNKAKGEIETLKKKNSQLMKIIQEVQKGGSFDMSQFGAMMGEEGEGGEGEEQSGLAGMMKSVQELEDLKQKMKEKEQEIETLTIRNANLEDSINTRLDEIDDLKDEIQDMKQGKGDSKGSAKVKAERDNALTQLKGMTQRLEKQEKSIEELIGLLGVEAQPGEALQDTLDRLNRLGSDAFQVKGKGVDQETQTNESEVFLNPTYDPDAAIAAGLAVIESTNPLERTKPDEFLSGFYRLTQHFTRRNLDPDDDDCITDESVPATFDFWNPSSLVTTNAEAGVEDDFGSGDQTCFYCANLCKDADTQKLKTAEVFCHRCKAPFCQECHDGMHAHGAMKMHTSINLRLAAKEEVDKIAQFLKSDNPKVFEEVKPQVVVVKEVVKSEGEDEENEEEAKERMEKRKKDRKKKKENKAFGCIQLPVIENEDMGREELLSRGLTNARRAEEEEAEREARRLAEERIRAEERRKEEERMQIETALNQALDIRRSQVDELETLWGRVRKEVEVTRQMAPQLSHTAHDEKKENGTDEEQGDVTSEADTQTLHETKAEWKGQLQQGDAKYEEQMEQVNKLIANAKARRESNKTDSSNPQHLTLGTESVLNDHSTLVSLQGVCERGIEAATTLTEELRKTKKEWKVEVGELREKWEREVRETKEKNEKEKKELNDEYERTLSELSQSSEQILEQTKAEWNSKLIKKEEEWKERMTVVNGMIEEEKLSLILIHIGVVHDRDSEIQRLQNAFQMGLEEAAGFSMDLRRAKEEWRKEVEETKEKWENEVAETKQKWAQEVTETRQTLEKEISDTKKSWEREVAETKQSWKTEVRELNEEWSTRMQQTQMNTEDEMERHHREWKERLALKEKEWKERMEVVDGMLSEEKRSLTLIHIDVVEGRDREIARLHRVCEMGLEEAEEFRHMLREERVAFDLAMKKTQREAAEELARTNQEWDEKYKTLDANWNDKHTQAKQEAADLLAQTVRDWTQRVSETDRMAAEDRQTLLAIHANEIQTRENEIARSQRVCAMQNEDMTAFGVCVDGWLAEKDAEMREMDRQHKQATSENNERHGMEVDEMNNRHTTAMNKTLTAHADEVAHLKETWRRQVDENWKMKEEERAEFERIRFFTEKRMRREHAEEMELAQMRTEEREKEHRDEKDRIIEMWTLRLDENERMNSADRHALLDIHERELRRRESLIEDLTALLVRTIDDHNRRVWEMEKMNDEDRRTLLHLHQHELNQSQHVIDDLLSEYTRMVGLFELRLRENEEMNREDRHTLLFLHEQALHRKDAEKEDLIAEYSRRVATDNARMREMEDMAHEERLELLFRNSLTANQLGLVIADLRAEYGRMVEWKDTEILELTETARMEEEDGEERRRMWQAEQKRCRQVSEQLGRLVSLMCAKESEWNRWRAKNEELEEQVNTNERALALQKETLLAERRQHAVQLEEIESELLERCRKVIELEYLVEAFKVKGKAEIPSASSVEPNPEAVQVWQLKRTVNRLEGQIVSLVEAKRDSL